MECNRDDIGLLMHLAKQGSEGNEGFNLAEAFKDICSDQSTTLQGYSGARFVLFSAYLMLLLQAGYAMVMSGSLSQGKNPVHMFARNLVLAFTSLLGFFIFGYGLAFGPQPYSVLQKFVGGGYPICATETENDAVMIHFLFQWVFASSAALIGAGSVAERISLPAQIGYAFFTAAFVYPITAHWIWDSNGWLSAFGQQSILGVGILDFGGASAIHVLGSLAGLICSLFLGPHTPEPKSPKKMCVPMMILGSLVIWFAWYGLLPRSGFSIGDGQEMVFTRISLISALSTATSGVVSFFINHGPNWEYSVCLGLLGGLLATTAGSIVLPIWAGIVCGCGSAIILWLGQLLLKKLRYVDPMGITVLHGGVGTWSLVVVALFSSPDLCYKTFLQRDVDDTGLPAIEDCSGLFLGGNGTLLVAQTTGLLTIVIWGCVQYFPFFFFLRIFKILEEDKNNAAEVGTHDLLFLPDPDECGSCFNWQCTAASGQKESKTSLMP